MKITSLLAIVLPFTMLVNGTNISDMSFKKMKQWLNDINTFERDAIANNKLEEIAGVDVTCKRMLEAFAREMRIFVPAARDDFIKKMDEYRHNNTKHERALREYLKIAKSGHYAGDRSKKSNRNHTPEMLNDFPMGF